MEVNGVKSPLGFMNNADFERRRKKKLMTQYQNGS